MLSLGTFDLLLKSFLLQIEQPALDGMKFAELRFQLVDTNSLQYRILISLNLGLLSLRLGDLPDLSP